MSVVYAPISLNETNKLTSPRYGEVKIGESIKTVAIEELGSLKEDFAIIGVKEDAGPQMNNGNPGANLGFDAFLKVFLNMQDNALYQNNVVLAGVVEAMGDTDSHLVEEVDRLLEEVVQKVLIAGKIPIVIGGGHNNCLPIIRACKGELGRIASVNIDPHADCRAIQNRHSGNGFSTAILEKSLDAYGVFGLHKAYNNDFILDFLKEHTVEHSFFEDYYGDTVPLIQHVSSFVNKQKNCGLEIDLDCIKDMPSSARSSIGWTEEQILRLIKAVKGKTAYLHLTEGASLDNKVGKFLAYAVLEYVNRQGL